MKRWVKYLKNKYILALILFGIYSLFLDENDIFSIISQKRKLNALSSQKVEMSQQLEAVNTTLQKLKYTSEAEKYARENKFFKKDNEDVFVISYE